jgi:hypothetical protein
MKDEARDEEWLMKYAVEGDDLCIRISLDAIEFQAGYLSQGEVTVKDRIALAMSLGRELCDAEDAGEEPHLTRPLDMAMERVLESADPSLTYPD